jgi:DNA helicase-2/ATP-dependent DNA helicase PcrA
MQALEAVADEAEGKTGDGAAALQARARNSVASFVDLIHVLNRAGQDMTPLEVLDLLLERSGYRSHVLDGTEEGEERWENIMELRTKARDFGELAAPLGLSALLEEVALVQDVDTYDAGADGVTLITLHAAKGLEFPFVFIVGMEEGLCPHSRSMNDQGQMEEERRLVYVGITRAMQGLYLVYAWRRTIYGSSRTNPPSRFLANIPPHLTRAATLRGPAVGARHASPVRTGREAAPRPLQVGATNGLVGSATGGARGSPANAPLGDAAPRFRAGDRVFHPTFGNGVVVMSVLARGDEEVTVAFEGKGVKKLSLAYAPLERA